MTIQTDGTEHVKTHQPHATSWVCWRVYPRAMWQTAMTFARGLSSHADDSMTASKPVIKRGRSRILVKHWGFVR